MIETDNGMADWKQKNLETLRKYRPGFYKRLQEKQEKKDSTYPCEAVKLLQARDGSRIVCVKREGKEIRLNSPYRPRQEAVRWAEQFAAGNIKTNAMLFGMGNGMFAEALLDRLQSDAKLFVVEPGLEIFERVLCEIDLQRLFSDERVFLCVQDINEEDFLDLLRANTHWTNLDTQIYCHHTGYDQLFPEAYRDFLTVIQKTDQLVQVNKDTQAYFAEKMVPNMLQNMRFLRESRLITDYVDVMPHDVPVIIIAAGPSLDKNIEELKRAKGKAFLLAVDTAMRHLLKHGIYPDAMVTLDPAKPFSYMNDPRLQEIPLFCILESNHEIMAFHQGLKIWFQGGSFLERLFQKFGKKFTEYNPGGSVATAAFMLSVSLEFTRIVLVGQDLAYQGETTHAGGETSHVLNEKYGIQMVDGVDGHPVKSRYDWIIYRDWFEEAIHDIEGRIDVIDATEGGALIHGSTLMPLREVIDTYCTREVDFGAILQSQPPVFSAEEYPKVRGEIADYVRQLTEMKRKAAAAAKDCEKAIRLTKKDTDAAKLAKYQQRVLQATGELAAYDVYDLVDLYMSRAANQYLSGVFVVGEDQRRDELEMYQSTKMIFRNVAESAGKLLPMFEKTVAEL